MVDLADMWAAVYFFFPETNGLHLEQVDQIFRDSKNALYPVKVAARYQQQKGFNDPEVVEKASSDMVDSAN